MQAFAMTEQVQKFGTIVACSPSLHSANLIVGLNRYGTRYFRWAKIKTKLFASSERTNVNLKDRYRQLLKKGDSRVKKYYN